MNEYFEIVDTEARFVYLQETQLADDYELLNHLKMLDHPKLNFALLNIGTLLQTTSIFFELKQNEIESALSLEKDKIRDRRMKEMVRELNEKINLRYGLDPESEIIEKIYIYEGQSYLLINKFNFITVLLDISITDIEEMNINKM